MSNKTLFNQSLNLACDSPAIHELNLSSDVQQHIQKIDVSVNIQQINQALTITYQVDIPKPIRPFIHFDTVAKTPINHQFTDKLWLDTCLECFIGSQSIESYVEINACPQGKHNGAYAVYHFDDYRHPDIMPPRPLSVNPTRDKANIDWVSTDSRFSRSFIFRLSQLPTPLQSFNLIHPAVILFYKNKPLFYAYQHASPADFHNKSYWSVIH